MKVFLSESDKKIITRSWAAKQNSQGKRRAQKR